MPKSGAASSFGSPLSLGGAVGTGRRGSAVLISSPKQNPAVPLLPIAWRRLVRSLLVLAVCAWGESADAQPATGADREADREAYRLAFGLTAPAGWTARQDVSGAALLVLSPRSADGFRPNLNVSVEGMAAGRPLEEAYRREFVTLRSELAAFEAVEAGEATVGALPARRFVYEHTYGGRRLRVLAYLVLAGGRAYTLTGTAPARRFEASQPAFEAMVQSFRPD